MKTNFKQFLIRCKNPKVITGIVSGVILILVNAGIIDTHMSNNINAAVNTLLSVGVGFGIFSNPDSHIDNTK
jgi:uncharacterized membrane protein